MASFVKCTTAEGQSVRVNLDHVALIKPYRTDRGFSGSEVVFSNGNPSSIIVQENQELLTGSLAPSLGTSSSK
jgi:hypothetical protein